MRIVPVGILIGTAMGGYVMRLSRKWTFVILTTLGVLACIFSVYLNMYVLFASRFLYGVIGGLVLDIVPKMI